MRKLVFLTGTRADYGKLKPLMRACCRLCDFEVHIYATGMHVLQEYGYTVTEIFKDRFSNIFVGKNQSIGEWMDVVLANTIVGFGQYIAVLQPDFIIVHGDRVEAFAGAIVGSFRNIPVIHIEGGEVSGTIDESIRHTVSKLAHIHMVANEEACNRIVQLGEPASRVFIIGSPEIDIMLSHTLPSLDQVKSYYEIPFKNYAILLYHPVTTLNKHELNINAQQVVNAVLESGENYVVIYPNNDSGCEIILNAYERLKKCRHVKLYSSVRFESFLTLLKNCDFMLGNSSSGIREAPVYAKYAINLGARQYGRYRLSRDFIIDSIEDKEAILSAIRKAKKMPKKEPILYWGKGSAADAFVNILRSNQLDAIQLQKRFVDLVSEKTIF